VTPVPPFLRCAEHSLVLEQAKQRETGWDIDARLLMYADALRRGSTFFPSPNPEERPAAPQAGSGRAAGAGPGSGAPGGAQPKPGRGPGAGGAEASGGAGGASAGGGTNTHGGPGAGASGAALRAAGLRATQAAHPQGEALPRPAGIAAGAAAGGGGAGGGAGRPRGSAARTAGAPSKPTAAPPRHLDGAGGGTAEDGNRSAGRCSESSGARSGPGAPAMAGAQQGGGAAAAKDAFDESGRDADGGVCPACSTAAPPDVSISQHLQPRQQSSGAGRAAEVPAADAAEAACERRRYDGPLDLLASSAAAPALLSAHADAVAAALRGAAHKALGKPAAAVAATSRSALDAREACERTLFTEARMFPTAPCSALWHYVAPRALAAEECAAGGCCACVLHAIEHVSLYCAALAAQQLCDDRCCRVLERALCCHAQGFVYGAISASAAAVVGYQLALAWGRRR